MKRSRSGGVLEMMNTTMTDARIATVDDRELLERFSTTGDERAFAAIVQRYTGLVFASCLRVLGDRAKAEDAAQETFFKLLRQPRAVDKTLAGWLHRVATRHCIDQLRRESRRKRRELAHVEESQQRIDTWSELAPHLDEALDELPEESRRLLVGHYLEGRTMRQLAADERSSPATVCRKTAAALELLRAALRKRGIVVLAAAMGTLLAQQPAVAAPESLHTSLMKMSMLNDAVGNDGWETTEAAVSSGKWLATASAAMVALGAAVGIAAWSGVSIANPFVSTPSETASASASAPTATKGGGATLTKGGAAVQPTFLALPVEPGDLRSGRLAMVQEPSSASRALSVSYADGSVRTLPREEVERLVEAQVGKPFAEFAATAQRVVVR